MTFGTRSPAYVEAAIVESTGGDVTVSATETAQIVSVVIGGTGSAGSGISLGGSIAVNYIKNTVYAHIKAAGSTASNVTANGNLSVLAKDTASIATLSGNVAASIGGKGSVGLAFAVNDINDSVSAAIEGSKVSAGGDLIVTAEFAKPSSLPAGLDVQIAAMAVSGGGASDIAGAGSVSLNWIRKHVWRRSRTSRTSTRVPV
jgi:hypothetical protein